MKLNNRDLALRGLLGVLPPHLERYLRSTLGDRCTPEGLRALLADSDASDPPDLADLSTQIRVLTVHSDGSDGLDLSPELRTALREVGRLRDEVVSGGALNADRTLAVLDAVGETLRLIGAESDQAEVRELIAAIDGGQGAGSGPLDAVGVEVVCVPVLSYAHAVAGAAPAVSIRLSLPGYAFSSGAHASGLDASGDDQQRRTLVSEARGSQELPPGSLEVTLTLIEDDGGRQIAEPWHLTWDTSQPVLTETRTLALDRANLLQVEPGAAHVRVELRAADGAIAVRRLPGLTVLPPRQWRLDGGGRWAGAALATFVQPDQAAIGALAAEALRLVRRDENAENAGSDGSSGPDALAVAACAALRDRRVMIKAASDPWQAGSHPIRTASGLLEACTGSVLDIAVLLAGVLERLGVVPVLLLAPKAVFLGYRRPQGDQGDQEDADGEPHVSAQDAADLIQRGVMGMIDPDLAVGASIAVLHELPDTVRSVALETLPDLTLAVPLDVARADGAEPQPMLDRDEHGVVIELAASTRPGSPDDASVLAPDAPDAPEADRSSAEDEPDSEPGPDSGSDAGSDSGAEPASAAAEALPAPPAVAEWKRNLLDLSRRNPLINRPMHDSIELMVEPDLLGRLESLINAGDLVVLRSMYDAADDASADAGDQGALLTEQRTVCIDLPAEECARRLQTMAASARTTLVETGANNLYLTLGSLVWCIDGYWVRSPLILIPVNLEQEGDTYGIVLDEAEASTPNHSLLARFKVDTGVDLVELREPVRDEHGIDVKATLDSLRRRLRRAGRRGVVVEPSVGLGMFRFSTYRMRQDLEENWPTITSNPLVGHLLKVQGSIFVEPANDDPVEDDDQVVENLPLVADSDQARVVADALAGRSLVVEGPPGTGKSQTVANIIFRALAQGRTVMFVAEKATTLDVVARRLREEAGIGDLLLNLHDNGMKPAEIYRDLRRALELRAPESDAADDDPDALRRELAALRKRLGEYREGLHDPRDGASYYRARRELIEERDAEGDGLEQAQATFEARARQTGLDAFDAAVHARLLEDYRDTLGRLRKALTPELLGSVLAHRDRVLREAGPRTEELRRELNRRRGTLNVRGLIDSYWDLVVAITPCLLVSPDSAARFFPADRRYVDVVIFDEASQITVAGAVGAMGRGRSVVVVGDPKQMPPAPVPGASKPGEDLEGANRRESGSILDRCLAGGVPSRRLTWHYRSRVESLIAFSNRHYYDGGLLTFPSPLAMAGRSDDGPDGYGVCLRRVEDGAYHEEKPRVRRPGVRPGTNPVEARQVVEEVVRRFEAHPEGVPSLGIITFSSHQCAAIEELLRKELGSQRVDEALEATDGLFVRSLENAQGEERDAILFSLTFSANERGDIPLSFGSLGHAGGERRLNVAITRARRQIVLFASFDPEDLRVEQSAHQGLRDLRAYLEQARSGSAPRALPASRSAVDLHRNEIAERLRETGLEVSVGVGHSSFEIDLVLGASGRPGVAVLLDGPGWDRRKSVMDRDLLPVDVLGTMGWERVERVWMPEWVADPDAVVTRLVEAAGGPPPQEQPAQEPEEPASSQESEEPGQPEEPTSSDAEAGAVTADEGPDEPHGAQEEPAGVMGSAAPGPIDYRQWRPAGELPAEILDRAAQDGAARAQVVEVARSICAVESPITRHRLIVKVCRAFGLSRINAEREAQVRNILGESFAYIDEHDFVWRSMDSMQVAPPYRRRALDHVDSIEEIHPRELVALLADVRATSPEWSSPEELYQRALRRLSTRWWRWRLGSRGVLPALGAALREAEREQ